MSSWIGQYLIKRHNIFVNNVMPKAAGNRNILTPEIMAPLPRCATVSRCTGSCCEPVWRLDAALSLTSRL